MDLTLVVLLTDGGGSPGWFGGGLADIVESLLSLAQQQIQAYLPQYHEIPYASLIR
jgi:hypothetical protein